MALKPAGAEGVTFGTTDGTVAEGDDPRIVGSAQKAQNLADLPAPASARAALGLRSGATKSGGYRNVMDYGALGDGVTDDTAAFVAAMAAGKGTVFLPAMVFLVAGLTLPTGVWLRGEGMHPGATRLKLKAGANTHVIRNYVATGAEANGQFTGITDLCIDGNKANNSGASDGIHFSTNPLFAQTAGDVEFDMHHSIENVYIIDVARDGAYGEGRSETRWRNVHVYDAARYGLVPSFDSFLESCTSGRSGASGFFLNAQSIRAVNCKSFWSGQNPAAADGAGFLIQDQGIQLGTCCAQDNTRQGILLNGCSRIVIDNVDLDSNSRLDAGGYAGLDAYQASFCRVTGQAWERRAYAGVSGQRDALKVTAGSYNEIRLTHSSANAATINSGLKAGSTPGTGNLAYINGVAVAV